MPACNAKYLLDVLGVLGSEGVRFELTGLLRPVGALDCVYVMVPPVYEYA